MNKIAGFAAVTLAVSFFVSSASAAKYEVIGELSDPNLEKILKVWTGITKGTEDTGSKAVAILEKSESEDWGNTVRQVLWSRDVEKISADVVIRTEEELDRVVESLFEENAGLQEAPKSQWGRLKNALKSVWPDPKLVVYFGIIQGGNGGLYFAYVSLVDLRNEEVLSIYSGYTE